MWFQLCKDTEQEAKAERKGREVSGWFGKNRSESSLWETYPQCLWGRHLKSWGLGTWVVFWPEVLWVALDVCRHLSWCRGEGHSGHYMVFFRIAFGAILTLDGRRKWQPTPVFLPGKSPWVEEPVGLWSMGSQRVRHKWRDLALLWVGGYSRQSCVDLQHQQPQRCCQKWRFGDPLTQTYKIRISRV